MYAFFFSSRRRHTRWNCDWSSDVCSSDLLLVRNGHTVGVPIVVLSAVVDELLRDGDLVRRQERELLGLVVLDRRPPVERVRSEERRVGKECSSRCAP